MRDTSTAMSFALLLLCLSAVCAPGRAAPNASQEVPESALGWVMDGTLYAKTPRGFIVRVLWGGEYPVALSFPIVKTPYVHASINVPLAPATVEPEYSRADDGGILISYLWDIGDLIDPATAVGVKAVEEIMKLIEVRTLEPLHLVVWQSYWLQALSSASCLALNCCDSERLPLGRCRDRLHVHSGNSNRLEAAMQRFHALFSLSERGGG